MELDYLAAALATRFIRRWDLYSRQRDDGRYLCVRERLHHDHLLEHVQGEITLGAYVLDEDSQGVYLVFDADANPDWRRLQALAAALEELDTTAYLENSRRGGHLWLFLEDALSGEDIRRFGQGLMIHFGLGSLELFPKQARVSEGPGSLIRLPFGVHRKSGRRYGFYTSDGKPLAPTLREQINLLEKPQTVPPEVIELFSQFAPSEKRRPVGSPTPNHTGDSDPPLFERVKQAIPVLEFVRKYVDLSSNGNGLCPFHNDHVESFSVHDERNYWKCFACGKSGSIIDFWMYYRDCDFNTAVNQLAGMLLLSGDQSIA
jgi:hypothetical protein